MKKLLSLSLLIFLVAACKPANLPYVCDDAQLIDHVMLDVPVEEGTTLMPGTHFTKAWLVKNEGQCDWSLDYNLIQVSGPDLGEDALVQLHDPVPAGSEATVAVRLTAPSESGSYTAEWMFQNADGEQFGTGPNGDRPLTMEIRVAELPEGVAYDFSQSVCLARWDSNRATFLSCEGIDDEEGLQNGYVRVNEDPALEQQSRNNPPVIEVKPNNQNGGFISGVFPPITIQDGDRFTSTVGCMDEMPGCAVVFRLEAQTFNADRQLIAEWEEDFDNVAGDFTVDLSDYADQEISLILTVAENGGRSVEARAFWLNPVIERSVR
jgi:hypothetical protein